MLDVLSTIVSGYGVPLRQEHVEFFQTVMVKLHKVRTFPEFYE